MRSVPVRKLPRRTSRTPPLCLATRVSWAGGERQSTAGISTTNRSGDANVNILKSIG